MRNRQYAHTFTVEGAFAFPIDMLRHDACWPLTETDSDAIADDHLGEINVTRSRKRKVTLTRVARMHWAPTVNRWESFGWKVIERDSSPI